ncbi:hypothetical protein LCGC14_2390410 [marine sediment metagenome]|uniref:Uncharacterized protein n=1 Tax=marine sediment metagenome TaxID=412755 RepID=A0A0F9EAM5_9ZZZZ
MGSNSIPPGQRGKFVDVPVLDESWDDLYFNMEQRYPKGVILHAATLAKAQVLRKVALTMARRHEYTVSTSVQEGDGDYLLYIWQL